MKVHQLMYFLEAAKNEHIGKAAKILAISPSAISHSIAALEEELGRQLFTKQGKHIYLTNHGKLLMERASKLVNEIETIKEEMISDDVELQGTYRLAASHLLCPDVMVPAWARLQESNPKLIGELYTLRSAQVLQGVSQGEFDLGLCFSPQSHPTIQVRTVQTGQLVIAVRKDHPVLRGKKGSPLQKIGEYPAVLPKSYQGIDNCETHPVFEKFSIRPRATLIFDNYEVAVRQVQVSDAWAFVPDWIASRSKLAAVTAEGWNAPVNISVLWPKNRILTRAMQTLISEVEKTLVN